MYACLIMYKNTLDISKSNKHQKQYTKFNYIIARLTNIQVVIINGFFIFYLPIYFEKMSLINVYAILIK